MNPEVYYRYTGPTPPSYNAGGGYARYPQPASYPPYPPGGVEYRHCSQPYPFGYPPGWGVPDPLPGWGIVYPVFARYRDSIRRAVDSQLWEAYIQLAMMSGVAPASGADRPPPYTASHGGFDHGRYSYGGGGYRGEYDAARWAEEQRHQAREDDRARRALGMPVEDTYYGEEEDLQGWSEHVRRCNRTCAACIFIAREENDEARYNAMRQHTDRANNERLRRAREAPEDNERYEIPPQRSGLVGESQPHRADTSPGVGFPPWPSSDWDDTRADASGRQTPPTLGPNPTISDGLRAAGSPALTVVAAESTRSEAGTQTDETSSWMDPRDSTMALGRGESGVPPSAPRDS